jgi:hypothetical protein
MYIEPHVKLLQDNICTKDIKNACNLLTEEDWGAYSFRQSNFYSMVDTTTFPFLWQIEETASKEYFNQNHVLRDLVFSKVKILEKMYNGTAFRVALTRLHPHSSIKPHIDTGFLQKVHRCHIPIITNPNVKIFIDFTPYHLCEGGVFEINNVLPHHVENNSDLHRIHLTIDILGNNE